MREMAADHGPIPKGDIIIRGRRDEDIAAIAKLRNLPGVRWGTLATPFESVEQIRKRRLVNPAPVGRCLVACIGDEVVGEAVVFAKPMPRIAHGGDIGIMVHDDWRHRGVGSALFAALIDIADNWMGLRRLELHVYTDNAAALALYKKFGFEIEATEIADAFRGGAFVDSFIMGRLRGDLPRDNKPYPPLPPPAPASPFLLRAVEPADAAGISLLMDQPIVRHGILRLPFTTEQECQGLAEPGDAADRSIIAIGGGEVVGIGGLKPGKNRRAHCGDVSLLAVHEAWQGRGVGTALMAALTDIADNWINLKRLHLTVFADNLPAIALYERFGFVVEGVKRADAFRAGGFADAKVMARVRGLP